MLAAGWPAAKANEASLSLVEEFVADLDLSFANLLDQDSEVYHLYRVRGMPTTFFIDRDGNVARQVVGFMADGQLSTYLDQLGLGE